MRAAETREVEPVTTAPAPASRTFRRLAVAGALALAGTLGAAVGVEAGERHPSRERNDLRVEEHSRDATLRAGEERASARRDRRVLSRAPWICTPSGFGRTASCVRRASFEPGQR